MKRWNIMKRSIKLLSIRALALVRITLARLARFILRLAKLSARRL
jgi:hypothetical protein